MRLYSDDFGHDMSEKFNEASVHLGEGTVPDRIKRANQRDLGLQEMVCPLSSILLLQVELLLERAHQDWPRYKLICRPKKKRTCFEMSAEDEAEVLWLCELALSEDMHHQDDCEEELPTKMPRPTSVRRGPGRIVDDPVPYAPGGLIDVTSDTRSPEFMKSPSNIMTKPMDEGEWCS